MPRNSPFTRARLPRSRWLLLGIAGVVIVGGLLLRSVPGAVGDVAGGILYAVLVFVLVAMLAPSAAGLRIGVVSMALCVAVELLQLTGWPTIAAELVPPIRYVLGTTFVASDLLAYAGGTVLAVVIDHLGLGWNERSEPGQ